MRDRDAAFGALSRTGPASSTERLWVADLHADSLLWGRDLLVRGDRGHVDVPRLIEGNVALQVLAASTKSPRHLNIERNDDRTDDVILLALALGWPPATWRSLLARALHLAPPGGRAWPPVGRPAHGSSGPGRTSPRYVAARRERPAITAGLLVDRGRPRARRRSGQRRGVADAGFRMMSPSHFFDNAFGGSAHGIEKGGLTERGREMVERMEARRMLVDVAHASAATIDDVLAMATRPVVASHTGVRGVRRQRPQPVRRARPRDRRDRRRPRDRVLADRLRRRRRRAIARVDPLRGRRRRRRARRARLRLRRRRPGAVRRDGHGPADRRAPRRRLRRRRRSRRSWAATSRGSWPRRCPTASLDARCRPSASVARASIRAALPRPRTSGDPRDRPHAADPNDVAPAVADLDTIVSLRKRRGFIFPSSEIYGGINAVWDYGPLGVELKNNVKRAWWRAMVQERDDIVGLDAGILMHPQVWVTSGHVGSFSDPLVECAT